MISEKDKQAILNGAYGITRSGRKVKFIGYSAHQLFELTFITLSADKISYYCPLGDIGFIYVDKNNFKATLSTHDNHKDDIIGLWEEPEPVTELVTLTLPCPLKEPRNEMWFISHNKVIKSSYQKSNITKDEFEQLTYFGSEKDAQAWIDAMRNNRK